MFHHRQSRIVAVIAVESGKPEELVAADVAAHAETADDLMVWRGIRLRRSGRAMIEDRNGERRSGWIIGQIGRRGLSDPLREGVPCAPVVLAVEEESLAVQSITAAFGANGGASAGGAHALCFHVAGGGSHLADGSFTYAEPAPTGPGLAARSSCRALRIGICAGGGVRAGACGDAEREADVRAVDRDLGGLLRITVGSLRRISRGAGGRRVEQELLPAASACGQGLQLRSRDCGGDCRRDGVWRLSCGERGRSWWRSQHCCLHEAGRHRSCGENGRGASLERKHIRLRDDQRELDGSRLCFQRRRATARRRREPGVEPAVAQAKREVRRAMQQRRLRPGSSLELRPESNWVAEEAEKSGSGWWF